MVILQNKQEFLGDSFSQKKKISSLAEIVPIYNN